MSKLYTFAALLLQNILITLVKPLKVPVQDLKTGCMKGWDKITPAPNACDEFLRAVGILMPPSPTKGFVQSMK